MQNRSVISRKPSATQAIPDLSGATAVSLPLKPVEASPLLTPDRLLLYSHNFALRKCGRLAAVALTTRPPCVVLLLWVHSDHRDTLPCPFIRLPLPSPCSSGSTTSASVAARWNSNTLAACAMIRMTTHLSAEAHKLSSSYHDELANQLRQF